MEAMIKLFFYTSFSRWFEEVFKLIWNIYLQFLDRIEIKEIIKNKNKYKEIVENAREKKDELQNMINSVKINLMNYY